MKSGLARGISFIIGSILAVVVGVQISTAVPYVGTLIATTAVYALAATGLDFVVGWLREISVGQAASMAVGAYCAVPLIETNPLLAVLAAAVGGIVTGVLVGLPAIRVRGFALATYTLVVGLGIQLLLSDVSAFGGTAGQAITPGDVFGLSLSGTNLVGIAIALLAAGIGVYQLLRRSMVGLSWRAVGQNTPMASSLSINPVGSRLTAFGIAGLFAGVAGLLFVLVSGYVAPDMFTFSVSVQLLAMVVIGGRVHPLGATVGATLIAVYTQFLPASSWSEALLGAILALSVWLAPKGIARYAEGGLLAGWRLVRPRRAGPPVAPVLDAAQAVAVALPERVAPPPESAALECVQIGKSYGAVHAVRDVSLVLRTGEITAIVGSNGAGKTTLLDLLSGAIPATAGIVRIGPDDVTGLAAWRRARSGLVRGYQDAAMFPDLTVRQALFVSAYREHHYDAVSAVLRLPHVRRHNEIVRERVERATTGFGLGEWLDTPLSNLSLGMVKIVQLAAVQIAEPQWILLDEPAAGLARAEVDGLSGLLRRMSTELPGSGFLIVEHDALLVSGSADRVVVMAEGSVAEDLTREDEGWDALLRARRVGGAEVRAAVAEASALAARPTNGAIAVAHAEPVPGEDAADGVVANRIATEGITVEKVVAADLTISYGRFVAVRGATLEIMRGRLGVLVGTNGAGKSSVLNAIVGIRPPAGGTVTLDGKPLGSMSPHRRVQEGLVLVPSGRGLMAALTVGENLRVGRGARAPDSERVAIDPLDLFPELRPRLRQRAGTLSGGEQQMLALARSVQLNPRYLLIDELSLGLSTAVVERLIGALLELREAGVGLLIVEQNAPLALSYSDHAYVMNKGTIAFSGPSAEAATRNDLFRPVFLDPAHA